MFHPRAFMQLTVCLLMSQSEPPESQLRMWVEKATLGGARRLCPHPAIINSLSLSARSVQTLQFPWHVITFHKSFSYPTSCHTSKPTNPTPTSFPPALPLHGLEEWAGNTNSSPCSPWLVFFFPFIVFLSTLCLCLLYSSWRQLVEFAQGLWSLSDEVEQKSFLDNESAGSLTLSEDEVFDTLQMGLLSHKTNKNTVILCYVAWKASHLEWKLAKCIDR